MAHVLVSAAHKSSGKTTVTIGLCAALKARGLDVRPFKKGPDYIDPMWLSKAAGRACYNLDFNTMADGEISQTFARHGAGGDIAVIEGNKGLFDGQDLEGSNSNAALAILLGTPVVLVVDVSGVTRGIAPLLLGYGAFDARVRIGGVILNKIGGMRHESKLRTAVEHYTDIPVLGAIHRDSSMEIVERHLGLVPSNEAQGAMAKIDAIAHGLARQVDLDALLALARGAAPFAAVSAPATTRPTPDVRIGIARDSAFGFYYPDDLEALEAAGADLLSVDMMNHTRLPDMDGLFLGGGFPETHMAALAANADLRHDIRAAVEAGLPTYAECGGLMYLTRRLRWRDETHEMAGVIPADAIMHSRPQGHANVRLRETGHGPWPLVDAEGQPGVLTGHEFHYSSLENIDGPPVFAYEMLRGVGIDGRNDGIVHKNLLASYAHLRSVGGNDWARRFVTFVRTCKDKN